ncbi:MAG TPA: hypothetical protein VFB27_00500, partial [Opitutaceae bacterium]|nr:hypothetical protein [Opitutaceae bacterium]
KRVFIGLRRLARKKLNQIRQHEAASYPKAREKKERAGAGIIIVSASRSARVKRRQKKVSAFCKGFNLHRRAIPPAKDAGLTL